MENVPQRQEILKSFELQAQIVYRLVEEYAASEKRYVELIEHIQEIVFECTPAGKILFLNGAWERLMGYIKETCLNRCFTAYVLEKDQGLFQQVLGGMKYVDECQLGEIRLRNQKGAVLVFELQLHKVDDQKIAGTLYNLTDRKAAEQNQADFNLRLRESNNQLNRFAYIVSHDLRGPLKTLQGFTQILQYKYRELLDDRGQEIVNAIVQESLRMQEMVEGLLEYSQMGFEKSLGE